MVPFTALIDCIGRSIYLFSESNVPVNTIYKGLGRFRVHRCRAKEINIENINRTEQGPVS